MIGTGRASTRVRNLHVAIWLAAIIALLAGAQEFPPSQAPSQASRIGRNPYGPPAAPDPLYEDRRLNALNADRHKSMVTDTEKLLRLAKQLDEEIAANTTDGLTSKEMKEVAEIEKLARNVKEKMARSYGGGGPVYTDPGNPGIHDTRFQQ
jgi:hypothetical protein